MITRASTAPLARRRFSRKRLVPTAAVIALAVGVAAILIATRSPAAPAAPPLAPVPRTAPPHPAVRAVAWIPHGNGSGPPTAPVCGLSDRIVQQSWDGWVLSRANAFDTSGQQLCIQPAPGGRPGFTILNSLRFTGAWQAYPFTDYGCAYWLCSPGSLLPMQVRRLPAWANTSFSWRGPRFDGDYNASYDIWFDDSDQISTEDDGAELMIWLRPNPGYRGGTLVRIGHRPYWFVHWRTCDKAGICWNYLQFRFTHPVHGVRQLWMVPFIRFCEARGLVLPSWWLTSVHAGYELVSGGKGLTTRWFNVHV